MAGTTDDCARDQNMLNQFSRTEILLGTPAMQALANSRVAVFGIGGVGGHVCEALVRSGVGAFDLVDNDTVSLTNLNRQIIATHSALGRPKVEVMGERMLDINPAVRVRARRCFFLSYAPFGQLLAVLIAAKCKRKRQRVNFGLVSVFHCFVCFHCCYLSDITKLVLLY